MVGAFGKVLVDSLKLELKNLAEVADADLQKLFNDERVIKYMPLAERPVSLEWVSEWKRGKSDLWESPDFGPWGVHLNDRFAGWAGLQPDGDACELAVVLSPWAWGRGMQVAEQTLARWRELGLNLPIYVYLPVARRPERIAERLGMRFVKNFTWSGEEFVQFELL